jgi:hypothetical protein
MLTHAAHPFEMAPMVGPSSIHGYYGELMDNSTTAVSAAFPSTNRMYYYPLTISQPCVAKRFWWLNGTAVSGANSVQVGLYNDNDAGTDGPGTSIFLGTQTTQAGTNVVQFDNITDTALYPGRIWIALWCSNTTSTFFRHAPTGALNRFMGAYLESGTVLPATATPTPGGGFIAVFGFATTA